MTNKKALNILSSHIETEMGSDEYYEAKEAYKVLEQDLEVLEILKKALKSNSIYLYTLKNSMESGWIKEEHFNKVKDWLERSDK